MAEDTGFSGLRPAKTHELRKGDALKTMAQHSVTTEMTRRRLVDALKKKMLQKPLYKITVKEIVEDTGLNRQTFYYHFQDIYALVEWMFEQEAIDILHESVSFHSWEEACLRLLRYIEENKQVCLCTLHSLGRSHLEGFFYKDLKGLFLNLVDEVPTEAPVALRNKEFLAHFYTIAFAGILVSWLKGELIGTPEQVIEMLSITVSDNIRTAAQRFSEKDRDVLSGKPV